MTEPAAGRPTAARSGAPAAGTAPVAPLVRVESVSKRYPGVTALDDVSLELRAGEVHALVGENGAGKSTLTKILAGATQPDDGSLSIDGRPVRFASPAAALRAGVTVVYQELSLLPDLSVGENLFLAMEPRRRTRLVDNRIIRARTAELLERLGADVRPNQLVRDLSVGQRQLVEIARGINQSPRLLILDEPTTSLSAERAETLFGVIRELCAEGIGVVYISHELEHVFELSHRVTVLRDGKLQSTLDTSATEPDEVIRLMVGRRIEQLFPDRKVRTAAASDAPLLSVTGLSRKGVFEDVGFELRPGEILGFSGLIGSGRTEVAETIFGLAPRGDVDGEVRAGDRRLGLGSPRQAVQAGIGFVPEDRKTQGLVLELSVAANTALPQLRAISRLGFLRRPLERALAQDQIDKLGIRTPSAATRVTALSGGNQQKVVLAKWLARGCSVLILDEPTRGVDIGARVEIYKLIRDIADRGGAVMLISSDLPEVIGLSDRVAVMSKGRLVAFHEGESANEETLLRAALGVSDVAG